jgi:hypothetical protein
MLVDEDSVVTAIPRVFDCDALSEKWCRYMAREVTAAVFDAAYNLSKVSILTRPSAKRTLDISTLLEQGGISINVIHLEAGHTRKRDTKSAFLRLFRSTTSYNNTITLALVYTILDTFLFLVLDLGSYSPR